MKYRKLRIAWSMVWGVVVVLLIALWIRSYTSCDNFAITAVGPVGTSMYGSVQVPGAVGVTSKAPPMLRPTIRRFSGCQIVSFDIGESREQDIVHVTRGRQFVIPHWLLLLLVTVFAATPWLPHRFSLRTLLIAMTLVAVGLGMIIWVAQ